MGAGVGMKSACVVNVEDDFSADEVGGEAVAADDAGAEVGEERGGGSEVVFAVALVDLGGSLGTVYIESVCKIIQTYIPSLLR